MLLLYFLKVLYSLVIVSTYLVFIKKFIELPQLKSGHLFPANLSGLGVNDAALALVLSEFEMVDQTRSCTRSDACLASNEVLVY